MLERIPGEDRIVKAVEEMEKKASYYSVGWDTGPTGQLRLHVDKETQRQIAEDLKEGVDLPTIEQDILDSPLGNGLHTVAPEDVGALTDGLILTDNIDDQGVPVEGAELWWDAQYQVKSFAEDIAEKGEALLENYGPVEYEKKEGSLKKTAKFRLSFNNEVSRNDAAVMLEKRGWNLTVDEKTNYIDFLTEADADEAMNSVVEEGGAAAKQEVEEGSESHFEGGETTRGSYIKGAID